MIHLYTWAVRAWTLLAIGLIIPNLIFAQTQRPLDASTLNLLKEHTQAKPILPWLESGDYRVSDDYTSRGRRYLYLQQTREGIDVEGHITPIVWNDRMEVLAVNKSFVTFSTEKQASQGLIHPEAALQQAVRTLGLPTGTSFSPIETEKLDNGQTIKSVFENAEVSLENIPVELSWKVTDKKGTLVWQVGIYTLDEQHYWLTDVDARTGEVLGTRDLVVHCRFDGFPLSQSGHQHQYCRHETSPSSSAGESPRVMQPSASYRVWDYPIESPNHGDRTLVADPWLRVGPGNPAGTLEWHQDSAQTYTITRGNNVHAYEDTIDQNAPGYSPSANDFIFDFPFDPLWLPNQYLDAAITNLFFWNNICHNVIYQYGFDEPSGNFQQSNLARGGQGGDYVRAEAQDGSGTNNANFFTPPDGFRPRMQMYRWTIAPPFEFTINSPSSIAGSYLAVESNYSDNNKLSDLGPLTGEIVLIDDGVDNPADGCEVPWLNAPDLNGKIALIDRGNCTFVEKAQAAQLQGAIAIIVVNNQSGSPFAMGGNDNSITIPGVMIGQADGNLIKDALENESVSVTMNGFEGFELDSDLDNGVIVHEYGHGISNRLTSGPSETGCLGNTEQMGEGWSDYYALMLTTDWATAQPEDIRGIGTYVRDQPTDGPGIRPYPYSTSFDINPATYDSIRIYSVPHGLGFVWATMLWDMTWKLIEEEGVSSDIYFGEGGNNIALNLVTEAMKLQPCQPGFVDGRDAILLADEILYDGKHHCLIWEAFANRGLGADADQGSTGSRNDGAQNFDIPVRLKMLKTADTKEIRERDTITYTITVISQCEPKSNAVITDTLSDQLSYVPGSGGNFANGVVSFGPVNLPARDTATFSFQAVTNYGIFDESQIYFSDNMENGTDQWTVSRAVPGGSSLPQINWQLTDIISQSPSNSWFAPNFGNISDLYLTTDPIDFSDAGNVFLYFSHWYETETNWDGGVVELSADGNTWVDLGDFFIQNGYNSTINVNPASPISGRPAFTGNSGNFVESIVDLSAFIGQPNVQIRFRMASDGAVDGLGWYLDDVQIINTPSINNVAQSFINGQLDNISNKNTLNIACGAPASIADVSNGTALTLTANRECTDDLGWTHYIDTRNNMDPSDDRLLLSIKKEGQNIGTVGDGIFQVQLHLEAEHGSGQAIDLSSSNYVSGYGADRWHVSNRWWSIRPNADGNGGQISAPLNMRLYYTNTDLEDLENTLDAEGLNPVIDSADYLSLYRINTSDAAPTPAVHQNLELGTSFLHYEPGNVSSSSWAEAITDIQFRVMPDGSIAEFTTPALTSGGLGVFSEIVVSTENLTRGTGKVQLFPNPADNVLQLAFPNQLDVTALTVEVRSITGALVQYREFENVKGQTLQLRTADWPNGSYILWMKGENGFQQKALITVMHK